MNRPPVTALQFLDRLKWLDGRLMSIEPYRRRSLKGALDSYGPNGAPLVNSVLCGRSKKNYKSCDRVLAGLYCLLFRHSWQGSDALIVANDADQARADLDLCRKLIVVNPDMA